MKLPNKEDLVLAHGAGYRVVDGLEIHLDVGDEVCDEPLLREPKVVKGSCEEVETPCCIQLFQP